MNTVISWIEAEWLSILIPVLVFGVTLVLDLLAAENCSMIMRGAGFPRKNGKPMKESFEALYRPSALWCLFISIYLAFIHIMLPGEWKYYVSRVMWTLLLVSLAISLLSIVGSSIVYYGRILTDGKERHIIFSKHCPEG